MSSRRPDEGETADRKMVAACARHLADLRRAYPNGAPDVKVARDTGRETFGFHHAGLATSPAALCAEFAGPFGDL